MEIIVDGLGRIVEGINAVASALDSDRVIELIYLNSSRNTAKLDQLIKVAKKKKVKVVEIKYKNEWTYNHRHKVAAICKPFETYKESDIHKFKDKNFIVCDHLQDTNNLGAIARSAAAFNFNVLAIPIKRSVKLSEKIFSISSGGLERIDILMYNSIFSLIKKFNSLDVWTIGLDMDGNTEIEDIDLSNQNVAIFLGSEESGLSVEIKNKLDILSKIKMVKKFESINVSVAAGIAMHKIFIKK